MTEMAEIDFTNRRVNVTEFTRTELALADLRRRFATVPDVNTDEGYEFVKEGLKELTSYRSRLEDKRQEIKAPYLQAGRIIDDEAKRLRTAIKAIEAPLREAKEKVDEREKRLKEERLKRLRERIAEIESFPRQARGKSAAEIEELIARCGEIDTAHDFYELTMEASKARQETLEELSRMHSERHQYEQAEEERRKAEEELARQRQEMERQQAEMRRQQQELERQRAATAPESQPAPSSASEPRQSATPANDDTPATDTATWPALDDWCARHGIAGAAKAELVSVVVTIASETQQRAA